MIVFQSETASAPQIHYQVFAARSQTGRSYWKIHIDQYFWTVMYRGLGDGLRCTCSGRGVPAVGLLHQSHTSNVGWPWICLTNPHIW